MGGHVLHYGIVTLFTTTIVVPGTLFCTALAVACAKWKALLFLWKIGHCLFLYSTKYCHGS